jgi:hypothetical protein
VGLAGQEGLKIGDFERVERNIIVVKGMGNDGREDGRNSGINILTWKFGLSPTPDQKLGSVNSRKLAKRVAR